MYTTPISGLSNGGWPVMLHGINTLPNKCVMKLPWESDFDSGERVDQFVGRTDIDQHTEELEQSVWWEKAP